MSEEEIDLENVYNELDYPYQAVTRAIEVSKGPKKRMLESAERHLARALELIGRAAEEL